MGEQFPVMWPYRREEIAELQRLACPRSVLWALVAQHEEQAQRNHYQTVKRLAERGGLSPRELLAVLVDTPWDEIAGVPMEYAVRCIKELVRRHEESGADHA